MRNSRIDKKELEVLRELAQIKWRSSAVCPHCKSSENKYLETRGIYQCNSCRKQFNVFTGTVWAGTRLKPSTFYRFTKLVFELLKANKSLRRGGQGPYDNQNNILTEIPIRELMRLSNSKSYSTVHLFLQRVTPAAKLISPQIKNGKVSLNDLLSLVLILPPM